MSRYRMLWRRLREVYGWTAPLHALRFWWRYRGLMRKTFGPIKVVRR